MTLRPRFSVDGTRMTLRSWMRSIGRCADERHRPAQAWRGPSKLLAARGLQNSEPCVSEGPSKARQVEVPAAARSASERAAGGAALSLTARRPYYEYTCSCILSGVLAIPIGFGIVLSAACRKKVKVKELSKRGSLLARIAR